VRLHQGEHLHGGENSLAHLRLQDSNVVLAGDRFIIRQFSRVVTIGGGVCSDILRDARQRKTRPVGFLKTLETATRRRILSARLFGAFGLTEQEIAARTCWPRKLDSETRL